MAVVQVRHALSSMQLQKVVGRDPSMWPYRVHVRHALSGFNGHMVLWLACLIFTAAIGVRIMVAAVKFHNVYDYTIERHPGKCLKTISHGFTQAV